MRMSVYSVCLALALSGGATAAHAQVNDLLKGLNKAVEGVRQAPAAATKQVAKKKLDLDMPESEYAFACSIKGKTLAVAKNFNSDDPNMSVSLGKRDPKTLSSELDFRSSAKTPLSITERNGERKTVTTLYFTIKDVTHGISKCDGMMCNPEELHWLSSFKNGQLVSQQMCDEEPVVDWKMPVGMDKNGKLRTDPAMKTVLQVKPSKIDFDYQR